jgi:hypothetical protein
MAAVWYPAFLKREGREEFLLITSQVLPLYGAPWVKAVWPVRMEILEATHTGQSAYAEVKFTPSRIRLSAWGVRRKSGFQGATVSKRCWSVVIRRISGLFIFNTYC